MFTNQYQPNQGELFKHHLDELTLVNQCGQLKLWLNGSAKLKC